jgi:hypothetical protein
MTNEMISISQSSTSLTYLAILHIHLHMVFISRNRFDMQELVLHMISFFKRQSTDKQADVAGVSKVSSANLTVDTIV